MIVLFSVGQKGYMVTTVTVTVLLYKGQNKNGNHNNVTPVFMIVCPCGL